MFDCDEMYQLHRAMMFSSGCNPDMTGLPATFYFDESGNDGSVHTNSGRLNVQNASSFFVLGGVATDDELTQDELNDAMERTSQTEIKSTKVFNGNFSNVLNGRNIDKFLNLMIKRNWIVHFCAVQPLYYAFVDIIDSLDVDVGEIFALKDSLFLVLRDNLELTVKVLRKNGGYPDINPEKKDKFLDGVIELIDEYTSKHGFSDALTRLRAVIVSGKELPELIYQTAEKSNVWVHGYWMFYKDVLIKYAQKSLVLDQEDKVRSALIKQDIRLQGSPLSNWRMCDSQTEPLIQVSDMMVSLIRKFLMFVDSISIDELFRQIGELGDDQSERLSKFCGVLSASCLKNIFLHQFICSMPVRDRAAKLISSFGAGMA